jgi:L-2,4-diaminobutyrate decarboxylase
LSALFQGELLPQDGSCPDDVLAGVAGVISESVAVNSPNTAAHLHCPPLIPALAAEVVISALNQSMDSFDQAPAATVLEETLVRWLCSEVDLGVDASGIFTSGGTQSNYMALLLARDACLERLFHCTVQTSGLPPESRKLRILCSDVAHFTVEKSAAQLGLGTQSVIRVATDEAFRMRVDVLRSALEDLKKQRLIPMAIVATAGTTDFGSVDPLPEIGSLARSAGAWFHVDAAYGSALLFSPRHRAQLRGIEAADSVSMDFHKLFWQPISCAAILLSDVKQFRYLRLHADYLNPELHEQLGIPNLVTRSLATTRRFDALKLWVSLRALGRKKLGEMIEATIDLAAHAADFVRGSRRLELICEPSLSCVLFRYRPANPEIDSNSFNAGLRQQLFEQGLAVIGHTIVRGRQCLKLTCMNPTASKQQIEKLLRIVLERGQEMETSRTT